MPNRALILIESNPPNFGQFLACQHVWQDYDEVTVCIIDKAYVMPTYKSMVMWKIAVTDVPHVQIIKTDENLMEISTLYHGSEYDLVFVSDKDLFVHLNSIGIEVRFLKRIKGYRQIFMRSAYLQSISRDFIGGII